MDLLSGIKWLASRVRETAEKAKDYLVDAIGHGGKENKGESCCPAPRKHRIFFIDEKTGKVIKVVEEDIFGNRTTIPIEDVCESSSEDLVIYVKGGTKAIEIDTEKAIEERIKVEGDEGPSPNPFDDKKKYYASTSSSTAKEGSYSADKGVGVTQVLQGAEVLVSGPATPISLLTLGGDKDVTPATKGVWGGEDGIRYYYPLQLALPTNSALDGTDVSNDNALSPSGRDALLYSGLADSAELSLDDPSHADAMPYGIYAFCGYDLNDRDGGADISEAYTRSPSSLYHFVPPLYIGAASFADLGVETEPHSALQATSSRRILELEARRLHGYHPSSIVSNTSREGARSYNRQDVAFRGEGAARDPVMDPAYAATLTAPLGGPGGYYYEGGVRNQSSITHLGMMDQNDYQEVPPASMDPSSHEGSYGGGSGDSDEGKNEEESASSQEELV